MITIIAGSRSLTDPQLVAEAVRESGFEITKVISGHAGGIDRLGEAWAMAHDVPLSIFQAEWERYGNAAGPIRNRRMAEDADALIAIWDGKSRGTADMIAVARRRGMRVYVKEVAS